MKRVRVMVAYDVNVPAVDGELSDEGAIKVAKDHVRWMLKQGPETYTGRAIKEAKVLKKETK